MIKLPFSLRSKDDDTYKASVAFAAYCKEELERRKDAGQPFEETRFLAAKDLAVARLEALEDEERV